ncbi:sulfite exporter TauE/SafE family protein [Thermobifida halotolerans]|uniref:Probable membrane transporter protein n=1 Tax=Thermobifida halotolerans TaxID=483545 RepID=A0A399FVP1_9ACTN|nr:sulfite exporter TauE/SafE family protein [Thermobifida halotolerans]UOE18951.1 sulfite exporter TauE/SafE family protein [Thermobifida halotolerans]
MALTAALFGVVIGLLLGLLGGGGSILAVPALVYGVGLPLAAAVPASLVVVGASSATGLLTRARTGLVRWRVALVFGLAGLPSAFGGSAVGRLLPDRWLMLGFAALMVVVAVRMLRPGPASDGVCRGGTGEVNWRACLPRSVLAGALVGFLTGLFGVGGGFVIVPALSMGLGLTAAEAVATSLAIIVLNSASGLAAHTQALAELDFLTVGVFAMSAMAAALAAGGLAARLPAALLRRGFAVLVLAVAAGAAAGALAAPELLL